jgi:D-alanine-D-alanine ligase
MSGRPAGKTRVAILFGGRSAEHEVSILSARNVFEALDRDRFDPLLIGIDKQGAWRIEPEATLLGAQGDPRRLALAARGPEIDAGVLGGNDVVFPVLHGTFGEDGTIQGLLDCAGVAYVGAGVLGSAVAMDKEVGKRLLRDAGIPVVEFRLLRAADHARAPEACRARASELGFPLFVKPANAGSSVGVSKVRDAAGLTAALADAFRFDRKVLCERAVDAREIECAVLGNDDPEASVPGEIVVHHPDGFYSYDAKYVDADGASWRIPADLPPATAAEVRRLAVAAFRALELAGLARVDFFLERGTGRVFLNEANTMPGFTAISMYPKMWEAAGLPPRALVSRLVDLALERHRARRALAF